MARIDSLIEEATDRLAVAGLDNPRREARLLMAFHLQTTPEIVLAFPERTVDDADRFRVLIDRRAGREPLSLITGQREFWSLPFKVTRHVLEPRPDSETLIEAVLERMPNRTSAYRIADFGVGTGCLLLSLLTEYSAATGVGVDKSADALAVAQDNAVALGLTAHARFAESDWAENLDGPFDIIVSNPPYIESAVIPTLEPEVVRFDPALALDGGANGLEAYRALIPQAAALLSNGGLIALEIGQGQETAVDQLLEIYGFRDRQQHKDLAGIVRVLTAHR